MSTRAALTAAFTGLLLFPSTVLATSAPAITVNPAVVRIDLATDPENFIISYTNTTDSALQLDFSATDLTNLQPDWQNYRYSLASWLRLSPKGLLLKPGETGQLAVTIRKDSLPAGGHYASVIADVSLSPPAPGMVVIKSQLITQVLVRAQTGHEIESAHIVSFNPLQDHPFTQPGKYTLRFENTGNTDLTPYGQLVVRDIFNHEIATGILNEDSLITLPESVRSYTITTSGRQLAWALPGPYTTTLILHYGQQSPVSAVTRFITFGGQNTLDLEIILLIIIFVTLLKVLPKVKRR